MFILLHIEEITFLCVLVTVALVTAKACGHLKISWAKVAWLLLIPAAIVAFSWCIAVDVAKSI